jgi:hypothetical protein
MDDRGSIGGGEGEGTENDEDKELQQEVNDVAPFSFGVQF